MSITNYIAVVKPLENGSFLISFPDFEGITATAETEESIQNVAEKAIKIKLMELKKANIKLTEPKKLLEVSKNLQAGEFTTYISVNEKNTSFRKDDIDIVTETFKDVSSKVDDFINKDIKGVIPEGKEIFLSIGGAILSILNTLIFPVYTFNGFFGIGKGGFNFFHINGLYIFFGLAFLIFGGLAIFASLKEDLTLLKVSIFGHLGLFVLCYLLVFVVTSDDLFISLGIIKFLLYIVSIILIYSGYRILNDLKNSND